MVIMLKLRWEDEGKKPMLLESRSSSTLIVFTVSFAIFTVSVY